MADLPDSAIQTIRKYKYSSCLTKIIMSLRMLVISWRWRSVKSQATVFLFSPGFSFVELSSYNPATSFNPGNDSFVLLTLPVNLLKPDSKYRFKLTVNDGSEEGVASLTVEVRKGPTARPSAGLSVSPSSVQALDVVTLSGESTESY